MNYKAQQDFLIDINEQMPWDKWVIDACKTSISQRQQSKRYKVYSYQWEQNRNVYNPFVEFMISYRAYISDAMENAFSEEQIREFFETDWFVATELEAYDTLNVPSEATIKTYRKIIEDVKIGIH